jgi:dephospho-CoA kinase
VTRIVGVTGNIASGKSTVAARLAEHGAALIDADVLARRALEPQTPALAAVAARWPSVIAPDGSLDRAALRRIVFSNPADREDLNAIVHPEVARLRDAEFAAARERGEKIVVYDVPLLFEAKLEHTVDVIVLVEALEDVRRQRLERRGLTEVEADAMIAAQMPSELKRSRARFVIDNNSDHSALIARTDDIWRALAKAAEGG